LYIVGILSKNKHKTIFKCVSENIHSYGFFCILFWVFRTRLICKYFEARVCLHGKKFQFLLALIAKISFDQKSIKLSTKLNIQLKLSPIVLNKLLSGNKKTVKTNLHSIKILNVKNNLDL